MEKKMGVVWIFSGTTHELFTNHLHLTDFYINLLFTFGNDLYTIHTLQEHYFISISFFKATKQISYHIQFMLFALNLTHIYIMYSFRLLKRMMTVNKMKN